MKLKEICENITDGSHNPPSGIDSSEYLMLSSKNIFDDKITLEDPRYLSEEQFLAEDKRTCIKAGDVLMTIVGTVGRAAVVTADIPKITLQRSVAVLHPHSDVCNSRFLMYLLRSKKNFFEQEAHGVAQKGIYLKQLSEISISIPAISQQEDIVDKLDRINKIIKSRQLELDKLDELIKARFVELFGDININDKGWDIEPLGNLCTIVRGGSPRPIEQFLGGDVPWIKIGDATDGDNIYLNSTKEHIIQEGVKKSRLVKAGSLIFANCGVSLGFARIITFDGCIHDGWLAMEDIDERLDKVFLLQALNQMTEHFRAIAPAGTQPNLNTAIMKAYRQVLPPLELQKEFIAFAKQVDKSKVAVQKSLDETQLLFDSLMQEYFG